MFLLILLTLSLGLADEKKEKSVIKKKVVMIASGNEQENRDINVEANIDDEILKLTITVDGETKEFEVPLNNEEAVAAMKKELEDLDVDIHISDFMGYNNDDDTMHHNTKTMRWHGKKKGGGYLGVQIQNLDGQLADYFGAKDGGVLVMEVVENGPSEKAGPKAGDIILSVEDQEVEDAADLVEEVRSHKPDSIIELNMLRKNRKRKMKVTLGKAPHLMANDFGSGNNMMFFGDRDDEDFNRYFNMDHNGTSHMMKKIRFYDNDDDFEELEDEMDELRNELEQLREEIKKLKKDS